MALPKQDPVLRSLLAAPVLGLLDDKAQVGIPEVEAALRTAAAAGQPLHHPLFFPELYQACHPDMASSGLDPLLHYVFFGAAEQRNPHPLFDVAFVRAQRPDLAPREVFASFLRGELLVRFSKLVNVDFVAEDNEAELAPLECFARFADPGVALTAAPHPLFLPDFYRLANDGPPSFPNEVIDYVLGNRPGVWTHPLFCGEYYILSGEAGLSGTPLQHYLDTWHEWKRSTAPWVDLSHLNHTNALAGVGAAEDPLSTALLARPDPRLTTHAHLLHGAIAPAFAEPGAMLASSVPHLVGAAVRRFLEDASVASSQMPLISIIVLNFRKPVMTMFSVLAALSAFRGVPVEVIVVDNESTPFEFEWMGRILSRHPAVRFIKPEENRFFGEGNNLGIDAARGGHVLFLNNDCFLHPDFGEACAAILRAGDDPAFGAVLYFPDGTIQEAGGLVSDCGQVIQRGKHLPAAMAARMSGPMEVDYCSAACFVIAREVLDRVWGFDPLFEPLYFEDTDLCMRIRQAGFRLRVHPTLRATHIENASTREFLGSDFNPLIASQRRKFTDRWFGRSHASPHGQSKLPAPPAPDAPLAIFATPFDIALGGGERYLLAAAAAHARTHRIVIAGRVQPSRARLRFALRELGLEDFHFTTADFHAASQMPAPEIMFCMGNEIEPVLPPLARVNVFHLQFPFPYRNVGGYLPRHLPGYDTIVVNSAYTSTWTLRALGRLPHLATPPVLVVAPPVRSTPVQPPAPHDFSLITVGRFFRAGHSKRQDIFLDIVEAVRRRTGIQVKARLVGSVHRSNDALAYLAEIESRAAAIGGVEILRDASRQDLEDTLARSTYYIHAAGFGVPSDIHPERAEHFGISVVEALRAGCVAGVYELGGPAEILAEVGGGFTYRTVEEAAGRIAAFMAGRMAPPALNRHALARFSDEAFADAIRQVTGPAPLRKPTPTVRRRQGAA